MNYLYRHFSAQCNCTEFFEDAKAYWIAEGFTHSQFTVIAHEGRIFLDGHFHEDVGLNQYVLNLVVYENFMDGKLRCEHHLDVINRYCFKLDYERFIPSPHCVNHYGRLKEFLINKMESICRRNKLSLLLDDNA